MRRVQLLTSSTMAVCALLAVVSVAPAATILKLNLGSVGPDVSMNGAGVLSTGSDGNGLSNGDQDTAVEYTGFLDPLFLDIPTSNASFTLNGLSTAAPAQLIAGLVIQDYTGGSLNLYDPLNNLLLAGTLTSSSLSGSVSSGSGVVFTTSVGSFTGGSLLPYVVGNSLNMTMTLSNINGGAGLSVIAGVLQPFVADSQVSIGGDSSGVPEPTSALLLMFGLSLAAARRFRAAR